MSEAWEKLFPHVQPHLPGCPEVVMREHIRDATIDFCERSEVWTYKGEPFQTQAGVSDYFVDVRSGSLLENLVSVRVDGFLVPRVSELYPRSAAVEPNGTPNRYAMFEDQQVRFFPTPDKVYEVRTLAVLKPSLTARGMESFIFETHGRTIACGAIASLAKIPGKEWTDFELATYHEQKFFRGADDAKGRDTRRLNLRVGSVRFD